MEHGNDMDFMLILLEKWRRRAQVYAGELEKADLPFAIALTRLTLRTLEGIDPEAVKLAGQLEPLLATVTVTGRRRERHEEQ